MILATDTISYFTTMVAIMRAGHIAFPVSPRNSPEAVAHLLSKVGVTHILVGSDALTQSTMRKALNLMSNNIPTTSSMFTFDELYVKQTEEIKHEEPLTYAKQSLESSAVILHSSGSTAFPKPILWTHYQLLQLAVSLCKIFFFSFFFLP